MISEAYVQNIVKQNNFNNSNSNDTFIRISIFIFYSKTKK